MGAKLISRQQFFVSAAAFSGVAFRGEAESHDVKPACYDVNTECYAVIHEYLIPHVRFTVHDGTHQKAVQYRRTAEVVPP